MTDQERAQILKMIEEGAVTPEEGLRLMQILEQSPAEDERGTAPESASDAGPASSPPEVLESVQSPETAASIKRVAEKGRSLWYIPLAIGIGIILLGGFVMYWNIHPAGTSAWAYCLGLPILLLGVVITALGARSRTARWLFVHVEQKPGERPRRIVLGFPLPLGLAAWFLRTFGAYIPNLQKTAVDEILVALDKTTSPDSPLIVNVDDEEGGEKVQVFIG